MSKVNQTVGLLSVGAMAIVLLGAGCMNQSQNEDSMMEKEDSMMEKEDSMMEKEDSMMEKEDSMMEKEDSMMEKEDSMMEKEDSMMEKEDSMMEKEDSMMMEQSSAGTFEAYSADKLSRASDGTVVLAFLADWCPTCRAFKTNTRANMSDIPAGLSILEVNYDDAAALRQKYGVTTQHTFVEVDASGMMLQKWTGGNTLDSVTERVS